MSELDAKAAGEEAVKRGLITNAQLDECLRAASLVTQAGVRKSLPEIMVDKGLITQVQAEIISRSASADTKIVAGFELLGKLGEGAMGAVYRARQISMDRIVALKILNDKLAGDKNYVARFFREARVAAKLDHVNIVRGIDVGSEGSQFYFAMEFVEGEPVGAILKRGQVIPEQRALHMVTQIARGLEHAWKYKLIHRDIKPDNILLAEGDIAKLADLGLAKSLLGDATQMTQTGVAMGTPHYISPEQARGQSDIDIRTDIYSLGATFYHIVTGETPFSGTTVAVVITKSLTERPVPAHVRDPRISERTSRVIAKMMGKDPGARYRDPTQLLEDLELVSDGKEPKHAGALAEAPAAGPTASMTLASVEEIEKVRADAAAEALRAVRRTWLIPAAILGGVALLGLVLVFALRGDKDEERARRELAAVQRLVASDKLDAALTRAQVGAELHADTELADRFETLVGEIEGRIGAAKKAAEEERARKETERREAERAALVAEARADMEAARTHLKAGRLAEARARLQASAGKTEAAGLKPEADALLAEIDAAEREHLARLAREREEEARRAEEAVREKELARLVSLGDSLFNDRNYAGALTAYRSAGKLKSTTQLAEKVTNCRFEMAAARGRAAEEKGDLAAAVAAYREALDIREDAAVRARLDSLLALIERRRELAALRAAAAKVDAKKTTDLKEIEGALEAARRAIRFAGEEEVAALRARAKVLEEALRYRLGLDAARKHFSAGRWKEAAGAAEEALAARPGDAEASDIFSRARKELARPRAFKNPIGMTMVWVPASEFEMGSDRGDEDEKPVRKVRLKGFCIGKFEVTNAQYERFDAGHAKLRSKYSAQPASPVVNVTWHDAVAFCRWLSKLEDKTYRLPTEAEWEYAARGADGREHPWGDEAVGAGGAFRANFGEGKSESSWARDGFAHAAPVGSFPNGASPFDCLDMAGNVREWCADWYGPYPLSTGAVDSPRGAREGEKRIVRGGSWYHDAASLRCANRSARKPTVRSATTGFRCVMEAE